MEYINFTQTVIFDRIVNEQTGEGSRGTWTKATMVARDMNNNIVAFNVWNKALEDAKSIPLGATVEVVFSHSAREYQGKYYFDLTARQINLQTVGQRPQQPAPQPTPQPAPAPTPSAQVYQQQPQPQQMPQQTVQATIEQVAEEMKPEDDLPF